MKNQPMNGELLDKTPPLLRIWVDEIQGNLTDLQLFAAIDRAVNEIVADIGREALAFVLEEYGDRFGHLKLGYGGHQKQWKAIEHNINAQGLTIYDMALDDGILLILSRSKPIRFSTNQRSPPSPFLPGAQTASNTTSHTTFGYTQASKSATSDTASNDTQSRRGSSPSWSSSSSVSSVYEEEFIEVKSAKFDDSASDDLSNIHIDPLTAMILFVPLTESPIEDTNSYFSDEESLFDEDLEGINTVEYLRLVVDGLFEEERSDCHRDGLSGGEFSGSERTEGAELENLIVAAVNEFMLYSSTAGKDEEAEIAGSERTAMSHETDRKWVPMASKIPRPAARTTSTRKFKPSAITAQTLGQGNGYKPNRSPATLNGPVRPWYIAEGLWTDVQIWMSEMDKEAMGTGSGRFGEADILPDMGKGNNGKWDGTAKDAEQEYREREGKKWW